MKRYFYGWTIAFLGIFIVCLYRNLHQTQAEKCSENSAYLLEDLKALQDEKDKYQQNLQDYTKQIAKALQEKEQAENERRKRREEYQKLEKKINEGFTWPWDELRKKKNQLEDQISKYNNTIEQATKTIEATETLYVETQKSIVSVISKIYQIKATLSQMGEMIGEDLRSTDYLQVALQSLKHALYATIGLWVSFSGYKLILYHLVAPILQHFSLTLHPKIEAYPWKQSKSSQCLSIEADPGQSVVVKNEEFLSKYDQSGIKKKTKWLLSWQYPIMSLFEGWDIATSFVPVSDDHSVHLDISHPDPDRYFISIRLSKDHPVFVAPHTLIAYTGHIDIKAHWHLLNMTAWLLGRLRYYCFTGDGIIVLQGKGVLVNHDSAEGSIVIPLNAAAAASSNVKLGVQRNETLWPYLLGQAHLFDMRLSGKGHVIQATSAPDKTVIASCRDSALTIIGKFLGF